MTLRRAPRLVGLLVACAVVAALAGCYRTHLIFDGLRSRPVHSPAVKHARINRTFVIGLIELDGPIPLDGICPSGVSYVYQRMGGLSWVLAVISGGIIEGRDLDIVCKDGSRAHLRIETKQASRRKAKSM